MTSTLSSPPTLRLSRCPWLVVLSGVLALSVTSAGAQGQAQNEEQTQTQGQHNAEAVDDGATAAPPTSVRQLSEAERSQAIAQLAPRHRQWLQSVLGLITQYELDYYLGLREEFRRDNFQEAFWQPRDPDPHTRENEMYVRWRDLGGERGALPFGDSRFLLYLLNGPPGGYLLPDGRPVARCYSRQRQLEIWFYGAENRFERDLPVVLLRRTVDGPFEIYKPGENLRAVQHSDRLPTTDVRALCADENLRYALYEMDRIPGYDRLVDRLASPPVPSREWLATIAAGDTDPPAGAELFEVETRIDFPLRNQSRTGTRAVLVVSRQAAPGERFDDVLYHHFVLVGEVIRDGRRLETFRYRFEGPSPEGSDPIPLGFTRFLRPGEVELRLLLEDVYGHRYAQVIRSLEVPNPDGLEAVPTAPRVDAGHSLQLVAPPGDVHAGQVRFRTQAFGDYDKVSFYLDGERKFSKRTPPYSVELDLGETPAPHRVRVVGLVGEQEVATDQIWLNQGAQRLRVGFVEPREGGLYPGSVNVRLEVETPDGQPAQKVELFVGDERVAELAAEPYTQTLDLPRGRPSLLRAVAHLGDGSTAEDAILVGASAFVETIEVRLVEVPVVVRDAAGEPVTDLERGDFRLTEDGLPRTLEGFVPAREQPLRAALMLDRSASMEAHLATVTRAAAGFTALLDDPEDRLALFSFNDRVTLDRDFGPNAADLERALAGLRPGGVTALWDGIVQALQSFGGQGGALVLFTDGQDEVSRSTFEQTLDVAHGSAVSVYVVSLAEAFPTKRDRRELEKLAEETGGRALFLDSVDQITTTYDTLRAELAARYLLTYTPSPSDEPRLRQIEVQVEDGSDDGGDDGRGRELRVQARRGVVW